MNTWHRDPRAARACWRRALVATLLAAAAWPALAAPKQVESFDDPTWASMKSDARATTVVVFTATWCAHCPAVFDQLARAIAQRRLKAELVGVVMDRAPGEDDAALLANAHYRQTTRLFAFDGQAARLRYGVDPQWRGVTPYIVVLAPGRPPRVKVGPPSEAEIAAWNKGR